MKLLSTQEIAKAIAALQAKKIIILPTDTIYGLSSVVNPLLQEKINRIKHCDATKPLIILISSPQQASQFVEVDELFLQHINAAEPTTIIYAKKDSDKTFALRLIHRPDLKAIIEAVGPIFSTSVNVTNQSHLTKKDDLSAFSDEVFAVFFTEELHAKPSKILNLRDFSKKRW